MAIAGKKSLLLLSFVALLLFSRFQLTRIYTPSFPPMKQLITKTGNGMEDASFIVFGFRAVAADIAWIQLLQTMGDFGHLEDTGEKYPFLKDETLRVVRIDPYFRSAYLFGAATLAWIQNINRPDEAMEILSEGVKYNPTFWPLRIYAAGIGYMRTNERGNMIRMLEQAVSDPDCPVLVKSILANAYKAEKRYPEALQLWQEILSSDKARDYHVRAREEIAKIQLLIVNNRL